MIYYSKKEDSGTYECRLPNGRSNKVTLRVIGPNDDNEQPCNFYYLDLIWNIYS